jgi:hypothetical protein
MPIPVTTVVKVKPTGLECLVQMISGKGFGTAPKGFVADIQIGKNSLPLYTVEFEDGTTAHYTETRLIVPEFCKCGTAMEDVCLILGTDSCLGCHELLVMEETSFGVVHYTEGFGSHLR